jgi:hypothetical protein
MRNLLIAVLLLAGCGKAPVVAPALDTGGFSTKDIPGDVPGFRREYSVRLNDKVSMKITSRWFIGTVINKGELDQDDGKWVLFDPENPADKILDRELLPLVQSKCKAILAFDESFRDSKPSRFIDENGSTWQRVR